MSDTLLPGIQQGIFRAQQTMDLPDIQSGAKADPKRAEEAATQFEAVLVQQMMKSMWQSVPKSGLLSGSSEEELYQDMLQQEVAQHISKYQSLGIKDMVLKELKNRGEA